MTPLPRSLSAEPTSRRWYLLPAFLLGYTICALLSQLLTEDRTMQTSYWLPSGLILGVLICSPCREWWRFLLAMLVGDAIYNHLGASWQIQAWLAVYAGNASSAVLGAWLVRRFVGYSPYLLEVKDLGGLVLWGGVVGGIPSALVGAWTIQHMGSESAYSTLWLSWFVSDGLGVLLMAPLVLVWRRPSGMSEVPSRRVEAILMFGGLFTAVVGVVVFGWIAGPGLRYMVFPFVIWAATRFGARGVTVMSLFVALLMGWFAHDGWGAEMSPLASVDERNALLQLALSFLAIFGLVPAIVIEAKRRVLAELQAQRNFHQAVFESAPDCLFVTDLEGKLEQLNETGLQFFEVSSLVEAQASGLREFVDSADWPTYERMSRRALIGEVETTTFRLRGARGTVRWLEAQVTVLRDEAGAGRGLLGLMRDVTSRRAAEEALRLARFTVDHAMIAMIWVDFDAVIVDANAAAARMLEYTLDELKQLRLRDVDLEFEPDRWPDIWRELQEKGSLSFSSRQRCRSGRIVEVEMITRMLRLEGRELSCAFVQDVTVARQHAVERRKQEEQLRLIFSAVGDGIIVQDDQLRIIESNTAAERVLGLTSQQIATRTSADLQWRVLQENGVPFTGEDLPATVVLRTAKPLRDVVMGLQKPTGELTWISVNAEPLCDATGRVIMVVSSFSDITASRALQEKVRQAQKMEVVGQLAGGVAHDFNNILTAMILNLQLIEMTPDLSAELREPVTELQAMARRAAKLTAQLLLFARQSVLKAVQFELGDSMLNVVTMLRRLLGEQITVELNRGPDALWVCADTGMIDQVLMNLCLNARDAMPNGGTISIDGRRVSIPRGPGRTIEQVGQFVAVRVRDTGMGIPAKVLPRVFEPFFTTKEVGQGTGLGLATAHSIMVEHKGWIEVESTVGSGTTFTFYLPVSSAPNSRIARPQVEDLAPNQHQATVLLVEDEVSVRSVSAMMLRRLGLRVIEAADGPQAAELWAEHGNEVDMMITDMVMPGGMSGLDLVKMVRETRPDVALLVMSGYSNEILKRATLEQENIRFLSKPFEFQVFAETVKRCLSARDDSARLN